MDGIMGGTCGTNGGKAQTRFLREIRR